MKYRNWIEISLQRRMLWPDPVHVGKIGGRDIYCITFDDCQREDYFIDFEEQFIEKVDYDAARRKRK